MKLSKKQLKKIVLEEIQKELNEEPINEVTEKGFNWLIKTIKQLENRVAALERR